MNKQNQEANLPQIDYSENLGQHWAIGFLGGVPQ